jgi:hypothetical protein
MMPSEYTTRSAKTQKRIQPRNIPYGIGYVHQRGNSYQARWREGTKWRAKSFDQQAEAEDWLHSLARIAGFTPKPRRAAYEGNIVYFIQAVDGGPIKIGHAVNPIARLRELQTAHHKELRILAVMDGGIAKEKEIHDIFADSRVRGEWFKGTRMLIGWIKRNATITCDSLHG